MAKTFVYELTILEHHLDTYGHVNNAHYLQMFEEARWDLVTRQGWGLKRVQEEKKGPIVLEIQIQFLKELKLREKIRIETQCIEYGKIVGKVEQKMISEKGDVVCSAIFTVGFFDLTARRLLRPTPEWLKILRGED